MLIVCLFLIRSLTASPNNRNEEVDNTMPIEMQVKGRGVFRFPDSVTPVDAANLIRRDFPDMLKDAPPLPSFAEKEQIQLIDHEGETRNSAGEHITYPDSAKAKNLTGGIGHLMSPAEIKKFPLGAAIPNSVVSGWFKKDTSDAERQTNAIIESFALEEAPDEVKQILFNMTFNLGETGLRGFEKMLTALSRKDYREAANQMEDSKWFGQVKSRGVDLVSRMNALADPLDNPPGVKFNALGITDDDEGENEDDV